MLLNIMQPMDPRIAAQRPTGCCSASYLLKRAAED